MKSLSKSALLILLSLFIFSFCTKKDQNNFSSEDGKFSILIPQGFETPKKETTIIPTEVGKVDITSYLTQNSTGSCMVMYNDFPESIFNERDSKRMFDESRDNALKTVNGTVEKEEESLFQGYPKRTIYLSTTVENQTLYSRFDFIIVKPRLYQIAFVGYKRSDLDQESIKKFFESFKIKK